MNTPTDEPGFTTTEPLVKLGQGDTETEYDCKIGCGSIMWPIAVMVCAYFLACAAAVIWGR
jgi:hypothetical protein